LETSCSDRKGSDIDYKIKEDPTPNRNECVNKGRKIVRIATDNFINKKA
jgi:hypothetical protein